MAAAGRRNRHGVPKRPGFDDLNMARAKQRMAVYTTIYPGVEMYLPDWYRSVREQTDQDFQLWIGLDGIEASAVETAIGTHLDVVWVPSEPGNTPARIRQRSLAQIVEDFDVVVLVDSDDILHPTRVGCRISSLSTNTTTSKSSTICARDRCRIRAGVLPGSDGTQTTSKCVPIAVSTALASIPSRPIQSSNS